MVKTKYLTTTAERGVKVYHFLTLTTTTECGVKVDHFLIRKFFLEPTNKKLLYF